MLGKRIVELRMERGLKQIELAEELGIANTTLSQYESGQRRPSDEVKIRMANFFDVTLDYLMDYKGEEEMEDERISERIWNLHKRRFEEEDTEDGETEFRVIYTDYTEDEIMQQLKEMSGKVAELNREIRVGLDAIHKKMEIKDEMKTIMKQFIREF